MLEINLSYNRLSGELPANICNYLCYLKIRLLHGNMFHGKISIHFVRVQQFQLLQLGSNNLPGTIPKEIGILTILQKISLGPNKLNAMLIILKRFPNLSLVNYLS